MTQPSKETITSSHQTDVAIIGAGPVGLFAIFECGMLGLKTHVIDALPMRGGQCRALYPEKPIYDIPAHPMISSEDLIQNLEKQAEPFHPVYHLEQQVVSLSNINGLWRLLTNLGTDITAKAVIIAGGAGAFGPNRPPLEGIERYEGRSIFYMVQQKEAFRGQNIIIAGGGDSAVDWALALAPIAKSVRLVHRRDVFRAAPESLRQLEQCRQTFDFQILTPYQLHGLKGEDGQLQAIILKDSKGGHQEVPVDILLPFFGLSMDLGPISSWGLSLDKQNIKTDPTTSRTSLEGIYAIGDIASYDNKKKLILTGFSEAAFAAYSIYNRIHPDQPLHFEYSTTKGVPE